MNDSDEDLPSIAKEDTSSLWYANAKNDLINAIENLVSAWSICDKFLNQ
jgi:hypothetical protein